MKIADFTLTDTRFHGHCITAIEHGLVAIHKFDVRITEAGQIILIDDLGITYLVKDICLKQPTSHLSNALAEAFLLPPIKPGFPTTTFNAFQNVKTCTEK